MAQRKTEVKMETTGFERRNAEGRKTRRRHGEGERGLEKVFYWTIHTKCNEGGCCCATGTK
jgi:hypothetical protein